MKLQDLFESDFNAARQEIHDRYADLFGWWEGGASPIPKNNKQEKIIDRMLGRIDTLRDAYNELSDKADKVSVQNQPEMLQRLEHIVDELEGLDDQIQEFDIG